jgi:hypothetical protein
MGSYMQFPKIPREASKGLVALIHRVNRVKGGVMTISIRRVDVDNLSGVPNWY